MRPAARPAIPGVMTERHKHPRTPHHPTSPGVGSDDRVARDLSGLAGEVVITEKMDGENTTLYPDGFHARSLEAARRPSQDWIAAFHARIRWAIPAGWRVCGEDLYARHSVGYDALPSYFLGFSAWEGRRCADWDETVALFARLGVTPVPVLWRGPWSVEALARVVAGLDTAGQEGVVVRAAGSFALEDFDRHVVKWVRAGHVTSQRHWRRGPLVPNAMRRGA